MPLSRHLMEALAVAVIAWLVSLSCLRLRLLPIGGVLDKLAWRLVLLLSTHPSLLLFCFKHHSCLLLLLLYSLIIWPVRLCLSIFHYWFLFFFLFFLHRLYYDDGFFRLLDRDSCPWLWGSCRTLVTFLLCSHNFSFLLSLFLSIIFPLLHNFLELLLLLFVDDGN